MKRLSVFVIVALTTASSAEAAGNGLRKQHHRVQAVHKSLPVETAPGPAVKRLPIPADTFRA
jgi:hypothetical protein